MKKTKKTFFIILCSFLALIICALSVGYYLFYAGSNVIAKNLSVNTNIILPKSNTFKVTSTAKGDNQSKLARIGENVYTFYLDNEGCADAYARGNDKTMRLLKVGPLGQIKEFDSIPVWMHGNILANESKNKLYVTTYEEDLINGEYFSSVKVYTYSVGQEITRISVTTLADDAVIPLEANPRVGADIDNQGNVAVAFGNYIGVMFVHVLNAQTGIWTKHSITYYTDTYMFDCVLYPYVRINGLNCIKVVANRDTSITKTGENDNKLRRDYSRYFSYDGQNWSHFIIGDLRDKNKNGLTESKPLDLFIDGQDTYIVTKEALTVNYYKITSDGKITKQKFIRFKNQIALLFAKTAIVNGEKYFVVSGFGVKGFKQTGYVEVYDKDYNLIYRNNELCNSPYLYIDRHSINTLDIMVISRDKKYDKNCETHFLSLNFE